jgi:AcrR family transcriptional regulator
MEGRRRSRLGPEERRAQLIALGVAFLAERPLDELTIEELASLASVSRALVFHYFGTRQGLQLAVVTRAGEALLEASEPQPGLPPQQRLRDTLVRIVGFARAHQGTFFSLIRGVASGDPVVRHVVDEVRAANAERLRSVFVEDGAADSLLLRVALRAWVSFAEEVLIGLVLETDRDEEDIVAFLKRTAIGVVAALDDAGR